MDELNAYQQEQLEALILIRETIAQMDADTLTRMRSDINPYLDFRGALQHFMDLHMRRHCTQACFTSQTSACCSKDGIITFWADAVINVIQSDDHQLDAMHEAIRRPSNKAKCIYLTHIGCCWAIRPLVCAMFICDPVQAEVIESNPERAKQWNHLKAQAKAFRWPERPVLFDKLELIFMERGCRSPLMYINTSPGLMRIKKNAGVRKG